MRPSCRRPAHSRPPLELRDTEVSSRLLAGVTLQHLICAGQIPLLTPLLPQLHLPLATVPLGWPNSRLLSSFSSGHSGGS